MEGGAVVDEHADRVGAVEVLARVHVLRERARHDDDVVGVAVLGDLLDEEVHQAAHGRVRGLKELGDAEEDLGGLRRVGFKREQRFRSRGI